MFARSWIGSLFAPKPRTIRKTLRRCPLTVETLEDRAVPAAVNMSGFVSDFGGLATDARTPLLFESGPSTATPGPAADLPPVSVHGPGKISLPENTTGKVVDLAGFFTDPDYTNSQIRMNLLVNGAPASLTVNLFDAEAPQTVASFFDHISAGDFNNVFLNRLTSLSGDGIGVLQGGAMKVDSTGQQISLTPTSPP